LTISKQTSSNGTVLVHLPDGQFNGFSNSDVRNLKSSGITRATIINSNHEATHQSCPIEELTSEEYCPDSEDSESEDSEDCDSSVMVVLCVLLFIILIAIAVCIGSKYMSMTKQSTPAKYIEDRSPESFYSGPGTEYSEYTAAY